VQPVRFAAAETESGHAGDHHGGGVMPGVTAAALAKQESVADLMALRRALGRLASGEVQHLADPRWQREDDFQAVDDVGQAAGVGDHVPGPDGATGDRLDLGHQAQAGGRVGGLDPRPGAVMLGPHRAQQRRPVPAGRGAGQAGPQPVPGQPGPAEPALCVLGQQRARPHRGQQRLGVAGVEPGGRDRAGPDGRQAGGPPEQDQPGA
jgi:hypothetical protein